MKHKSFAFQLLENPLQHNVSGGIKVMVGAVGEDDEATGRVGEEWHAKRAGRFPSI